MCLILDSREPAELAAALRAHGLEVEHGEHTMMEYGDIVFEGQGEHGPATFGIERKKLSDLVGSMTDRRLSGHQLRGMFQRFEYAALCAEGEWRCGKGGEIEHRAWDARRQKPMWMPFYRAGAAADRRAVSHAQLHSYLFSLQLRGRTDAGNNLILVRTHDLADTAAQVAALYRNFTEKRWDAHHAHDQIYSNSLAIAPKGHGSQWAQPHSHDLEYAQSPDGRAVVHPGGGAGNPTTAWRWAADLPGIDRRAEVVARHFGTARAMALASEAEWQEIDFGVDRETGRRRPGIGPATARAVVRAITEEGG